MTHLTDSDIECEMEEAMESECNGCDFNYHCSQHPDNNLFTVINIDNGKLFTQQLHRIFSIYRSAEISYDGSYLYMDGEETHNCDEYEFHQNINIKIKDINVVKYNDRHFSVRLDREKIMKQLKASCDKIIIYSYLNKILIESYSHGYSCSFTIPHKTHNIKSSKI